MRVSLTNRGRDLLYVNRARRDLWLAEAIERCLTEEERARLFGVGDLLERIAFYSGSAAADGRQREKNAPRVDGDAVEMVEN